MKMTHLRTIGCTLLLATALGAVRTSAAANDNLAPDAPGETIAAAIVTVEAERDRCRATRADLPEPPSVWTPAMANGFDLFGGSVLPPWSLELETEVVGTGAGLVVGRSGLVATAREVISGADRVFVRTADGRRLPAEVIARGGENDLALLRADDLEIEPAELAKAKTDAGAAELRSPERRVTGHLGPLTEAELGAWTTVAPGDPLPLGSVAVRDGVAIGLAVRTITVPLPLVSAASMELVAIVPVDRIRALVERSGAAAGID